MTDKYSHEELVEKVDTPGWRVVSDDEDKARGGTLGEVLQATHESHQKGEHPGLIQEIETAIELDLIQMQQLWRYLGLPV